MASIVKDFDIYLSCNDRGMSKRSQGFIDRLRQTCEKDRHRFCQDPAKANVLLYIQNSSDNQLHISVRSTNGQLYPAQVDLYRQSLKTIGFTEKTNRQLGAEKDLVRKIILICAIAAKATANQ